MSYHFLPEAGLDPLLVPPPMGYPTLSRRGLTPSRPGTDPVALRGQEKPARQTYRSINLPDGVQLPLTPGSSAAPNGLRLPPLPGLGGVA